MEQYVEQPREWEMKSLKDQKTKEMDQKTHGSKVTENQPNLEGHKWPKKQKTWTGVKLSAIVILTKKPKFWTAVNLSAMDISVFSISFSFQTWNYFLNAEFWVKNLNPANFASIISRAKTLLQWVDLEIHFVCTLYCV